MTLKGKGWDGMGRGGEGRGGKKEEVCTVQIFLFLFYGS